MAAILETPTTNNKITKINNTNMNSETNQCNHEHHDCCGHHHEESNKYLDMLALYNTKLNDAEVSEAVRKIIAEKVHENDNDDVKRFLFGSIELTSLKTTDSEREHTCIHRAC